jgi:hypothetical protein
VSPPTVKIECLRHIADVRLHLAAEFDARTRTISARHGEMMERFFVIFFKLNDTFDKMHTLPPALVDRSVC